MNHVIARKLSGELACQADFTQLDASKITISLHSLSRSLEN